MQKCNTITTIIGTNEERVMVDSHIKFVVNLRNIQGVMSVYSHKKGKTSVTAIYRGNSSVANLYGKTGY